MIEDKASLEDDRNDGTQDADTELKAINAVVDALKPLKEQERRRALEYILARFGALPLQTPPPSSIPQAGPQLALRDLPTNYIQDIRRLKETKDPKSANEMAALVAYYVSELAAQEEKKKQINKIDIERYFKTAGFKLPADASFTLVNAKNAGYLDTAGGGQYTLNPVGYNLVVHRMGLEERNKKKPASRQVKPVRSGSKKTTPRRKK